ncbi:MAG: prenyltransferase/squalene oxidase repeat-containing protein [Clostridiales bacterium]|nr:terpene cyclase/mutase family protein [Clostridiales bacterium]MDU3243493.1 prenyltransferase/squalene oxidase repeat-containing protein [Clostridiales bacterium]
MRLKINEDKLIKKLLVMCTACCILAGIFTITAEASHKDYTPDELLNVMKEIINWRKAISGVSLDEPLMSEVFLDSVGSTAGDWAAIGIGRSGYADDYNAYLAVTAACISKSYQENGYLDRTKATEWQRIGLAVLSAGGDPVSIGEDQEGNPIDLVADGSYNRGKVMSLGTQGTNGLIFGLLLMDSMRYDIPADAADTREGLLEKILSSQIKDGGFNLTSIDPQSDVDMTAMALQALAPYYNSEKTYRYVQQGTKQDQVKSVRQVVDEALQFLSSSQQESGGFTSWRSGNSESCSQVLIALTSLGIDPGNDQRFIKNGNTVIDGLMQYHMEEGGFIHSKEYDEENPDADPDKSNTMASDQALCALTALCRYYGGMRNLYDFRPEQTAELKKQISDLETRIHNLREDAASEEITAVYDAYEQIPAEERSYVSSYAVLADIMAEKGIVNNSEPLSEHMDLNTKGNGTVTSLFGQELAMSANIYFTEEDVKKVDSLPDPITSESYVEVVTLLDKYRKSENKEDYKQYKEKLEEKIKEIDQIKETIKSVNEEVTKKLYPLDKISLKDKEKVEEIQRKIESLSAYDQTKILQYEDILQANVRIKNQLNAIIAAAAAVVLVVILVVIVAIRMGRRKRLKNENYIRENDD